MGKQWIIVRGGGDIATGTIHRLWSAGLPVLVLEAEYPSAIRRQVAVSEAVYDGEAVVEGMKGVRIQGVEEAEVVWKKGHVPVLVDAKGKAIERLSPSVVVDGILAKRNLGTHRAMAPLTVALGPGFEAGKDVDMVIETMRGHNLGRILRSGHALPDTGVPGNIGGYTSERVIHAEAAGIFRSVCRIGDIVSAGDEVAKIERTGGRMLSVKATISGIIRGLLRDGYPIPRGFKIADIDPRREELANCFTISDKARCIAGSVLEVVAACYFKEILF